MTGTGTYSGTIVNVLGSGSKTTALTFSGSGNTLTLNGSSANTYTGGTIINAGTINANANNAIPGSNGCTLTVNSGGTFIASVDTAVGSGLMITVTTGGTATFTAAGNHFWSLTMSGGTFTDDNCVVGGHITINGGTMISTFANGTTADDLNVTGAVTLGSSGTTLNLSIPGGTTLTQQSYTLVSAGGAISGQFATVLNVPNGYQVQYNLDAVQLVADWSQVALGGGGNINGIVQAPSTASIAPNALYCRANVGGAYRWVPNISTDDGGAGYWAPITDGLSSAPGQTGLSNPNNSVLFGITSVAVDPTDGDRVFVMCGTAYQDTPSGIYVTNDAQDTNPVWTLVNKNIRGESNQGLGTNIMGAMGERLCVDPYDSSVLYCGTLNVSGGGTGLMEYYSSDGMWDSTSTISSQSITQPTKVGDANSGISFVACDPNGTSVNVTIGGNQVAVSKYIYVGAYSTGSPTSNNNGGVFAGVRSSTTISWSPVLDGTSGNNVVEMPYRGQVASDGTLYVTFDGTDHNGPAGGVVETARGGGSGFTSIAPGGSQQYCGLAHRTYLGRRDHGDSRRA